MATAIPAGLRSSARSSATGNPTRRERSLVGLILRGFGWLVLALAVVGAGAAGGAYLYAHETLNARVRAHAGLKKTETNGDLKTVPSPSQPAIALVAGYDVRGAPKGPNPYAGSNSDTLMLLRADPTNNTLSLLSFPRDLYVPIYCHGDTVDHARTASTPPGRPAATTARPRRSTRWRS